MRVGKYVWWDDVLKRFDLTFCALIEQANPKVHTLVDLVVRSWFIPIKKEVKDATTKPNEKGS